MNTKSYGWEAEGYKAGQGWRSGEENRNQILFEDAIVKTYADFFFLK